MILILLDLPLQLVQADLLVLDHQVDLQLLDAETESNKLGRTPNKTILLDGTNIGLELAHIGLIIPWLHIHGHNGLGSRLCLASLLLGVLSKTLLSDTCSIGILLLVITAEEVDIVVTVLLVLSRSFGGVDGEFAGFGTVGGVRLGWVTRQRRELGFERLDVLVPTVCVGVLLRSRGGLDGLEGLDVGLGRTVAGDSSVVKFGAKTPDQLRLNRRVS